MLTSEKVSIATRMGLGRSMWVVEWGSRTVARAVTALPPSKLEVVVWVRCWRSGGVQRGQVVPGSAGLRRSVGCRQMRQS